MKICSHTVVKNGMPFIGHVLNQVAPYMDKMFVTISQKSDDGTIQEVMDFIAQAPCPVELGWEEVPRPGMLTQVQQFMVDRTTQDWILFLSDDDYWPRDQLELCLKEIEKAPDTPAFSVTPYQLLDWEHYDKSWEDSNKGFSKFLKNDGLHYVKDWPDEMPVGKDGRLHYWRANSSVIRLPYRYYHLSYLKGHSFRNEEWATRYRFKPGSGIKLEKPLILGSWRTPGETNTS